MLRDLDRLHASTETHCRVGLCNTTSHATADATHEVAGPERLGVVFGFGGDEKEDGAFGGGFDPGPGNETLVVYRVEERVSCGLSP